MRRKEKEIIIKTYFIISDETCETTFGHFENGPERKKRGGKKKERKKNKKENTPRDFFYLPNPYLFFSHFFTHKNTYFPSNFVFYYHPKNKLAKILEVLPRHPFFFFFFSMKDSLWFESLTFFLNFLPIDTLLINKSKQEQ